ncbi:MAG: ABC transporter permease [Bacteroidota bacterium]
MIFNYLKIAFRNLMRNKVYSLINIMGLSLGVGCCLLLSLYIQDEMSYDQHHKDLDNIYRVITQFTVDSEGQQMTTTSPPIALTLRDEIQEIESATRALNPPGVPRSLIKYEDKLFYETDGLIADSSLFEVLTYDVNRRHPKTALVEPNSVVISDKLSRKLFGDESGLDKTITIGQGGKACRLQSYGRFQRPVQKSFCRELFHIDDIQLRLCQIPYERPWCNGAMGRTKFCTGLRKACSRCK